MPWTPHRLDAAPKCKTHPLGIQGQLGLEVGTGGLYLVQVGLVKRELSQINRLDCRQAAKKSDTLKGWLMRREWGMSSASHQPRTRSLTSAQPHAATGDRDFPLLFASARSAFGLARSIHCWLAKLDAPGQQWTSQTANSKAARQICSRPPLPAHSRVAFSHHTLPLSHSEQCLPYYRFRPPHDLRPRAVDRRRKGTFFPVALIGKVCRVKGPMRA